MTRWKSPPIIKLYEALGTIGDKRIKLAGNTAEVHSSSGDKHYEVRYDPAARSIMANDNGSYWQGYLGYPGLAYLLARGVVEYDSRLAQYLSGFAWKEINTRFKNDWAKSEQYIRGEMVRRHPKLDLAWFDEQLHGIMAKLEGLKLEKLGPRVRPPSGS
jgi:hypothetical protein